MTTRAYYAFADWLHRVHPELFAIALAQLPAGRSVDLGYLGDGEDMLPEIDVTSTDTSGDLVSGDSGYGSITDAISASTAGADIIPSFTGSLVDPGLIDPGSYANAIAPTPVSVPESSTISNAVSAVGSYLSSAQGLQTVLNAANQITTATQAAAVINAQAQRAAAGQAPANIQYATTYDPATGTVTAVPTLAGSTQPLTAQELANLAPSFLERYGIWIFIGALVAVYAL